MTEAEHRPAGLPASAQRLARNVLAVGENRFELFLVELQEERERVFRTLGMLLAMTALALLAGIGFTLTVILLLWDESRVWPIAILTVLYAGGGAALYHLLQRQAVSWQTLPETCNQLRRDLSALSTRLQ